jgi:predicted Zn-ribbon and HTH transcriptional regulator
MLLAIFGINNTALSLAATFAILSLVAIWIALIVFTFIDARRRISDPFLVGCATAASFFPFVGTIVYTILRPAEFLDDVRERETEMKSAETELRHLEANSCHKCGFPTHADFVRCPACRSRLKEPCPSCDRPVGLKWKVCPYCEHTLIASKRSKSSSKTASRSSSRAPSKADATVERRPSEKPRRPERQEQPRSDRPSRSDKASRSERTRRAPEGDPATRSSSPDATSSEEQPRRSRRARRETSAPDAPETPGPERPASSQPTSSQPSSSRSSRRRIVVEDDTEVAHRPINSGESVSPAPEPERG